MARAQRKHNSLVNQPYTFDLNSCGSNITWGDSRDPQKGLQLCWIGNFHLKAGNNVQEIDWSESAIILWKSFLFRGTLTGTIRIG